jgi:hypothetical protein
MPAQTWAHLGGSSLRYDMAPEAETEFFSSPFPPRRVSQTQQSSIVNSFSRRSYLDVKYPARGLITPRVLWKQTQPY